MTITGPAYALVYDYGGPAPGQQMYQGWPPPDGIQGLCTMRRPDGTHVLIYDAGATVPHHVRCDLPDGTPVVAGINHYEVVEIMRRVNTARRSGRDPDSLDIGKLKVWLEFHGPHQCPDGCDA